MDASPILSHSDHFVPITALSMPEFLKESLIFSSTLRREQDGHRPANHFVTAITKDVTGPLIPRGNHPIESQADESILRIFDNGRELRACFLGLLSLGDILKT